MDKWQELRKLEKACRRCPLREGCTQVVPGAGPTPCPLMFVGEAPGSEEDERGLPFVGASGGLLDRMLRSADIKREDVFISNVVRCHPPMNRTPEPEEIAACKAWLWEEIKLVDPLVVVTLGGTAGRLLLRGNSGFRIGQVVGVAHKAKFLREGGIIVPVYHPSFLLQRGMDKVKDTVRIFKKVKKYVDEHSPDPGTAGGHASGEHPRVQGGVQV